MGDTIDCPRCEHEHEPNGIHEDDHGEWTCEECGFEFVVEVEYDPCYSERCKSCQYGPVEYSEKRKFHYRRCEFCQHCIITEPTK